MIAKLVSKHALELTDSERAELAAELIISLPATLADYDDGVAEATRRANELEANPESGLTWGQVRSELGR